MSAEDMLKDTSIVAIIAGAIGLIILFVNPMEVGVLLLGLIGLLFGLVNYLKNNKDIIALIAMIFGAIVVVAAILKMVL
jgi:Mn2+/Fe2+ NRAMP family transporter